MTDINRISDKKQSAYSCLNTYSNGCLELCFSLEKWMLFCHKRYYKLLRKGLDYLLRSTAELNPLLENHDTAIFPLKDRRVWCHFKQKLAKTRVFWRSFQWFEAARQHKPFGKLLNSFRLLLLHDDRLWSSTSFDTEIIMFKELLRVYQGLNEGSWLSLLLFLKTFLSHFTP